MARARQIFRSGHPAETHEARLLTILGVKIETPLSSRCPSTCVGSAWSRNFFFFCRFKEKKLADSATYFF